MTDLPQCYWCGTLRINPEADVRKFLHVLVLLCAPCYQDVRRKAMAKAPPPIRGVVALPSRQPRRAPRIVPAPDPVVMELARELSAAVRA